jgi:hypothetical protein
VLGSIGATLGQMAGAQLGSAIDQQVFGAALRREGPRLTDIHLQASTEGASIPAVYGSVRIAGQVIWAARFKERVHTSTSGGGKGAARVRSTNHRYSLSFAVGLCEGEIARVARVWANGELLDLSRVAWRLHTGAEDQAPDALIEAIEGADAAPAYRGLAYVVFEDLPLEAFGNVIPQLSFEVVRPAPTHGGERRFEDMVRGVCLIPGAGEFVYATDPVLRRLGPGQETPENVHAEPERANLLVSLDQLAADFPNCETVMLVVSWFGGDLRCGECKIRPGVEVADKQTTAQAWRAGGVERAGAHVISMHNGAPAYGGTPSDSSVLQAIAELKARGYKVGLYPFLMMDVPHGNTLPDPNGAASQPAYPWRGRIGVHPAPGRPGSPDKTGAAAAQIEAFFGAAQASDFTVSEGLPAYVGPNEWSYRRFVLHNAKLAALAGGVDVFLIGSELRGVTTARGSATHFPAVAELQSLAGDVRSILGAGVKITYAADWSEYRGHQPRDGSGDVLFHLDPLWADANIDMVGIDWYPPLTDWRDGEAHLDAAIARDVYDLDYLEGRIEAGEDFDWHYADDAARAAQARTPITDGAHGEPWVYRAKDVRGFWSNAHYDRPGGVRAPLPTAWVPQSKPIWLTELGCPAIDRGGNAPNLFVDAKSAEDALPHFSRGGRDDLIQRRVLEAYLRHWDEAAGANPISPLNGRRMVEEIMLWAWDARPYPAFPARGDVWADGANWRRGHWLNGRAGLSGLGEVVLHLCARAGVHDADATALRGAVSGFVVDAPSPAREALEPLMAAYGFNVAERGGRLVFFHEDAGPALRLTPDDLTAASSGDVIARRDGDAAPIEVRVRYLDAAKDYLVASASARRLDSAEGGVVSIDAPLVLEAGAAEALAQRLLAARRGAIETLSIEVGPAHLALEPGDSAAFGEAGGSFEVVRVEDGATRRLELQRTGPRSNTAAALAEPAAPATSLVAPAPVVCVLDLPVLPNAEDDDRTLAAVFASPWFGQHEVRVDASVRGRAPMPAVVGELVWALWPGPVDRWDDGNAVRVRIYGGELASVSREALLNGENAFAIDAGGGEWEIVQASRCTLVGDREYELSGFLRGCLGSAHAMRAPHPAGARIVRIDDRLARLDIQAHEWGEQLRLVVPPAGASTAQRAAVADVVLPHAGARLWAPAHLRAVRLSNGDVSVSWVRCARSGDAWGPGDPPLGAASELYRLDILGGAGLVRSVNVAAPSYVYSAAAQTLDFASPPPNLLFRVAQVGDGGATGLNAELTITL